MRKSSGGLPTGGYRLQATGLTHRKHEKVHSYKNTSNLSIRSILRPVTATASKGVRHTAGALDHRFDSGTRARLNGRPDHFRGCQFKLEHCGMFVLTFQLSAANFVDVRRPPSSKPANEMPPPPPSAPAFSVITGVRACFACRTPLHHPPQCLSFLEDREERPTSSTRVDDGKAGAHRTQTEKLTFT